jgi:probable phosphoglycerate mutase
MWEHQTAPINQSILIRCSNVSARIVLSYTCFEHTQQGSIVTQLLLIRHAVNDVMKSKRLAGWMPEVHINDEGQQQAHVLAERLRHLPITAIYSSPLERTRETAAPLAQALGLDVHIRDTLGEVQYGEWTGKQLDELSKLDEWKIVQRYPSGMRFPGGEAMRDMQHRIVNALDAIAQNHPREIVAVFSHADVIKAALAHYLGMHLDLFQRIMIEPTSVSVIGLSKYGPAVVRVNDHGPLQLEPEKEAPVEQGGEDAVSEASAAAAEQPSTQQD